MTEPGTPSEKIPSRALLVRLLDDQSVRWRGGERPAVEAYLRLYPELADQTEAVLDLIYNEVVQRGKRGEGVDAAEYLERFPQLADALRVHFEVHGAIESAAGSHLESTLEVEAAPVPSADRPAPTGYEILGVLGRGGMGVVYRARQIALKRVVALKMIRGGEAGADALARFRVEAEAVARLRHPHIVQVYEVGEYEGSPYFSMEFVAGGSLRDQLDGTPWLPARAAALIETLARAMEAAHRAGIVHRDLKPRNVLLDVGAGTTAPKIADFGLAKRLDDDAAQTLTGAVLGTPSYMAPEQASGRPREVGPAADVYALGAILYELLTGRPPFRGATVLETLDQVRHTEPVAVRQLQPKTPRDLETICLKCLAKDPRRRYASAAELADDLRRFQDGAPVRSRPVNVWERAGKWVRRRPTLAALWAAGILLALAAVGVAVALQYSGRLKRSLDDTEAERKTAAEQRDRAENFRYAADMNLGLQAWHQGRLDQLDRLLVAHVPADGQPDRRGFEWHYLRRLAMRPAVVRTPPREPGGDVQIALRPDGGRLIALADYGRLRWLDLASRRASPEFGPAWPPEGGMLLRALLSPDGSRYFRAEETPGGEVVAAWDLAGEAPVRLWSAALPPDKNGGFSCSPRGRWLTFRDEKLHVVDAATGREVWAAALEVATFCFTADDRKLIVFAPGSAAVHDAATGRRLSAWDTQSQLPQSAVASGNGLVALVNPGQRVAVWDVTTGRLVATLGASSYLHHLAFSDTGPPRLAGPCEDGVVRVWDATHGDLVAQYRGHRGRAMKVAFAGDRLASLDDLGTVHLWDLGAEPTHHVFPVGAGAALAAFSPAGDRLTIGSAPGSGARAAGAAVEYRQVARVLDLASGRQTEAHRDTLRVGELRTHYFAISGDGQVLAGALAGQPIRVLDLLGAERARFQTPGLERKDRRGQARLSPRGDRLALAGAEGGWVRSLAGSERLALAPEVDPWSFSDDGTLLAATAGNTVLILDLRTEKVIVRIDLGAEPWAAALSPDGTLLAAAGADVLVVWAVPAGREIARCPLPDRITALTFSPDGERLASLGLDRTLRLWLPRIGQQALALPLGRDGPARGALAFRPDGRLLAVVGGTGLLFDARPPSDADLPRPRGIPWPDAPYQIAQFESGLGMRFSPEGSRLAHGATILYAADPTNPARHLSLPAPGKVLRTHFSPPNGDRLLTVSEAESRVRLWDGWTGRTLGALAVSGPVREALFTPAGTTLVLDATGALTSFGRDGEVLAAGAAFDPNLVANGLALSPDGKRACAAVGKGNDWAVKVWDIESGEELIAWPASERPVWGVAWSADGVQIASCGVDRTVRLWDADTGRLLQTLTGATATVARVALAPDGTEVAGLCLDGTVRRWASNSGAALPTLQLEAVGLKAAGNGNVDYSPDGRHLAASASGVLSIWTPSGQ